MLRLRTHLTGIFFGSVALALSASLLHASDASQAEARALLEKAEQLSRLATKGASPFTFQATIRNGAEPEGATFFLVWADEEHWRATVVA